PVARSFFGLHVAADLGPIAGTDVCSTQDAEFECFDVNTNEPYPAPLPEQIALSPGEPGDPYPGASVGGVARGSLRVLLSYDRVLLPKVSLGGRLGVAFNGGPSRPGEP